MLKNEVDHSLLSRFYRQRNFDALEEFVRRHRHWAIRQATSYSPEDAEDIVQISILRLITSKPRELPITNPLGWWRKIIVSTSIDHVRSQQRRQHRERDVAESAVLTAQSRRDPATELADSQVMELIHNEINQMSANLQRPLKMRYFGELSYGEISKLLGIRTGTVSSRINRSIRHIQKAIAEHQLSPMSMNSLPTINGEATSMSTTTKEVLKQNHEFANQWKRLWTVSGIDFGRVTSTIDGRGNVRVKWREDFPETKAIPEQEYPERAKDRRWTEIEVLLTDARSFQWTKLYFRYGATGKSLKRLSDQSGRMPESECEITPLNEVELKIQSSTRGDYEIEAPGTGPLTINSLLPLVLCSSSREDYDPQPIRLLGTYVPEEDSLEGQKWFVLPANVRYKGKTGRPMRQGHEFEFSNLQGIVGQHVSLWEDPSQEISGCFWPEEGVYFTRDEAAARAMIGANSQ